MKDKLYIIGAGEFGRELESWITISDDGKRDWAIAGYIDDGKAIGPLEFPSNYEVVGTVDGFDFKPEVTVGNTKLTEEKLNDLLTLLDLIEQDPELKSKLDLQKAINKLKE